ncbi:MAG TPA: CmcJ/NvfI family oxidoreductase [Gammaproteobacteria bacterium]|nr:CmcJ/NvfI family oxidoreductase [Gammaproteobacteria bacterium]
MSVQAEVEYLSKRTERPVYYASSAGRNAKHEIDQPMNHVTVEVADARERDDEDAPREFGQHPSGFDLLKFPARVEDFLDSGQIEQVYEPEVIEFLKRTTGAYRVHLFDHTVRASSPELREIRNVREPATLVHNDYTSKSGFVCLDENLGDDAENLKQGRFQIVNVWRPLSDPVEDYPLALVDARSVAPAQVVDTERRSPTHVGEIQLALHDPAQRWYYYSAMRPDEVLMFKTFDSIDGGTRPCTIHTAIKLPDAPPGAKPRESIETRAFLFFD